MRGEVPPASNRDVTSFILSTNWLLGRLFGITQLVTPSASTQVDARGRLPPALTSLGRKAPDLCPVAR